MSSRPEARRDLDEILAYLAQVAGTPIARRYGSRFRAAFRHLIDFPETGARRPGFGPKMRIWAIAPYVIFYRFSPAEHTIYLARIVHGRRNVTPRLFDPRLALAFDDGAVLHTTNDRDEQV